MVSTTRILITERARARSLARLMIWLPFTPTALIRYHRSTLYDGSPMPHSIFFLRGYAIHGSYEIKHLGRPASHGCIRLHPSNAAALYSLVQRHGTGNTLIKISN